jgi:hypothetical protein
MLFFHNFHYCLYYFVCIKILRFFFQSLELHVVSHTYNPSYMGGRGLRESQSKAIPGKNLVRTPSQPVSQAWWCISVIMVWRHSKRITVWSWPWPKMQAPTKKITNTKKGLAQVEDYLSTNCESLSSNPSTAKKKKKKSLLGICLSGTIS